MGISFIKAFCLGVDAVKPLSDDAHLFVNVCPKDVKAETSTPTNKTAYQTPYPEYHWAIPDELNLKFPALDHAKNTWTQLELFARGALWSSATLSLASFAFAAIPHQSHLKRLAGVTAGVFLALIGLLSYRRASSFVSQKKWANSLITTQREKIRRFRGQAYENPLLIFKDTNNPLIERCVNHETKQERLKYFLVLQSSPKNARVAPDTTWPDLLTDPELKVIFTKWNTLNNFTPKLDPSPLLIRTFLKSLFEFKDSLGNENSSCFSSIRDKLTPLFEALKKLPIKNFYLIEILQEFQNSNEDLSKKARNDMLYFGYASRLLWMKMSAQNSPSFTLEQYRDELYENLFLVLIFHSAIGRENSPLPLYNKYISNRTDIDPSIKDRIEKIHDEFFKFS